ncbi:hypothetical protein Ssi03_62600 [Sphaerisporangium siamense]|uniref:Uncharacterized protein n=1 Tax=Sphaerisporangium siamense TaxID=795645 RepID=A0A7W7D951_9ACTN|nr:hypothetical protein [Sphaerisporangium siamense]MBB4702568.1 hypothetical protein [Sphaerisporangium siamense]GII88270.1 hypothetical protein Ssi03_62600 [Sphaerisporangium siamense]
MTQLKELSGDLIFPIPVPGQSTAATPDEFTGIIAPFNMKITAVRWIPKGAVTANGTNYFTLTLRNRKADASGTAQPATRSYAATNSSALVPESMTLSATAADLNIAAGDHLTVEKLVTASGLAMPAGTVQVYAQAR